MNSLNGFAHRDTKLSMEYIRRVIQKLIKSNVVPEIDAYDVFRFINRLLRYE